jgi:linoleoyl-CoA desaturase
MRIAKVSNARREAWLGWASYAAAVHLQLMALAFVRLGPAVTALQVVLLGVTLASALLSVVHDAGHSEFSRRPWVNVLAAQIAVPIGLWVGQYRIKHRVHHNQSNVYAVDESTVPHPLLRVHPLTPRRSWHRFQHMYAPALYAVAWVGDLRSQVRYLRTGMAGTESFGTPRTRAVSYVSEKLLTAAVLMPYILIAGPVRAAIIGVGAVCVASLAAALVLIAGHVNLGLEERADAMFIARTFTTTAAFATDSPWMRRLTGGLTHHHVHHLRPHAARSTFAALQVDVIAPMAIERDLPLVEFPTLRAAIAGHFRQLRELGAGSVAGDLLEPIPVARPEARVHVGQVGVGR